MRFRLPILLSIALALPAAAQLPPATTAAIDRIASEALADTQTPSASIAVVKDGRLAYVQAYGNARLDPAVPARPQMRYAIGSVSKQFTAAAILLLVQEGKLSLDDPVARFLPSLTRAGDITVRQLLTHTSGYQDYYPLDYVAPFMRQPATAEDILTRWARKPLDFPPGAEWQYSNTNYVAAGRIIEKVSGVPLWSFLRERIFRPLGLATPLDLDRERPAEADAAGYTHFGLAPPRPVAPEGLGWLFAAGELGMTARDLALWDISLIEGKLLKPAAFTALTTPARLNNGAPTQYGLGVNITNANGHPKLAHGGAISGFVSQNTVWPDQGAAVAVLTNLDGSSAAEAITAQIAPLLLSEKQDPQAAQELARARRVFAELEEGKIDRSALTADAEAYFTPQVLADAASSLKPLGTPQAFNQLDVRQRGGMSYRHYAIRFANKTLILSTFTADDGKLAQYLIQ